MLNLAELQENCHTKAFYELQHDVVVRRGAIIKFALPCGYDVKAVTARLADPKGRFIEVCSDAEAARGDSSWVLEVVTEQDMIGSIVVRLQVPIHARVARFRVDFDVQLESSSVHFKLGKYLVVLCNSYAAQDTAFLPAELRTSFLEEDHGVILMGTENGLFTRGWLYAQYTKAVLVLATSLLEQVSTGLSCKTFIAEVLAALWTKMKTWQHYPHVLGSHNWILLKQGGERETSVRRELPSWVQCALATSVLRFYGIGCRIVTAYNAVQPASGSLELVRHFHLPCLGLDRTRGIIRPFTCWNEIWLDGEWHVFSDGHLFRVSTLKQSPELQFVRRTHQIEYLFDVARASFDTQKLSQIVLTTAPSQSRNKIEDVTNTYTEESQQGSEEESTDESFLFSWKLAGLQRFGQELHMKAQVDRQSALLEEEEEQFEVKYLINVACFQEGKDSFHLLKVFSGSSSTGLEIRRILHRVEYEKCLSLVLPTLECTCLVQLFNEQGIIVKTFCRTQLIMLPFYEPRIKRMTPSVPVGEVLKVHVTFRNMSSRIWKETRLVYTFSGNWEYNKIKKAVCCTHRCGRVKPGETRSTTLFCKYPDRRAQGHESLVISLVAEGLKHAHRTFHFKVEQPREQL